MIENTSVNDVEIRQLPDIIIACRREKDCAVMNEGGESGETRVFLLFEPGCRDEHTGEFALERS